MKIGIKTFDKEAFLKYFENKVDFFEIMAVQKNDYAFLKHFSLPIVLHAEHEKFGINPADISKKGQNLKSINFAIKIADMINAKKIIAHPGTMEKGNKSQSLQNAINFFREINDKRILIENLPTSDNPKLSRLCRTPRQIKEFMKKTNTKFCFDVNHTLELRERINGKYSFIKKYLKLNPTHYHIGGQNSAKGETHLCFLNSEFNLKEALKYYPDEAKITLETEKDDIRKVESDIQVVKNVLRELRN